MRVGEGGLLALIAAIEGQLELVFVAADLVPVPFCVYSQRKSLGKPQ